MMNNKYIIVSDIYVDIHIFLFYFTFFHLKIYTFFLKIIFIYINKYVTASYTDRPVDKGTFLHFGARLE